MEENASLKSDSDLDESKINIKKGKAKKVKLTESVRFSLVGSFPYVKLSKNINLKLFNYITTVLLPRRCLLCK